MGKWLDLAREIDSGCAVSALSAVSPPKCTNSPNCNGSGTHAQDIGAIGEGLQRLKARAIPRNMPPATWRTYLSDARWLVESGVAADALAQGWSPLDLFGISADEQWQCLAAWIGGRRDEFNRACLLLREMNGDQTRLYATQSLTGKRRWHYPDPAPKDARLPWTM